MSKDWTKEQLEAASKEMKSQGHMSYEEFCESLYLQADVEALDKALENGGGEIKFKDGTALGDWGKEYRYYETGYTSFEDGEVTTRARAIGLFREKKENDLYD